MKLLPFVTNAYMKTIEQSYLKYRLISELLYLELSLTRYAATTSEKHSHVMFQHSDLIGDQNVET